MISNKEIKNNLNSMVYGINEFMLSDYFPFILGIFPVLFFILDMQIFGIIVMTIFTCLVLVFSKNFAPFIAIVLDFVLCIRDGVQIGSMWYMLLPLGFLIFASFVYRVIKYKVRFHYYSQYLPMALVFIVSLLGGIGSEYMSSYTEGLALNLGIQAGSIAVVVVFTCFTDFKQRFDYKRYFCISLIAMLIFSSIEFIAYNNKLLLGTIVITEPGRFAWWNTPVFGQIAIMAIACSFYLYYSDKKIILPTIFILFFVFISYYCHCRGALLTTLCFMPFYIIFLYRFLPLKTKQFFTIAIALIILFLLFAIYKLGFSQIYFTVFKRTGDTGRTVYYELATEIFMKYPILGGGICSGAVTGRAFNNFHSLLYQPLATTGIIGFCCYVFLHIRRIKIMGKRYDPYHICMMVCYITYTVHSMIDCGEYVHLVIFYYMMITITEHTNNRQECLLQAPHYTILA